MMNSWVLNGFQAPLKKKPKKTPKTCRGHGTQQSVYFGAFPDSAAVSAAHFNNSLRTEQHHECFRLKCFSQPAAPIKPLPFARPRERGREEGREGHRLPPFPGRLIHFLGLRCNCSDGNQGTDCFSETAAPNVSRRPSKCCKMKTAEGWKEFCTQTPHPLEGFITRDVVT